MPPFSQGEASQGSATVEQSSPLHPTGHSHLKLSGPVTTHVPLLRHGFGLHGCTSMLQSVPWNPGAHVQITEFETTEHVAPFWHGLLSKEQGSTIVSHIDPVAVMGQMHSPLGEHVPPFRHGLISRPSSACNAAWTRKQSSMVSQDSPPKPAMHSHVFSTQVPPFSHGQAPKDDPMARKHDQMCQHVNIFRWVHLLTERRGGGQGQPKAPQKLLLVHTCNRKEGQQQCPACCAAPHGWLVCVCVGARVCRSGTVCLVFPFFLGGLGRFQTWSRTAR